MIWLIFVLLGVLAIVFFVNKYQNSYQSMQGNVFNLVVVFLLVFLVLSLGYVYLKTDFNLTSFNGFLGFFKAYFAWILGLADNFNNVAGYAVKQNWSLNSTG